MKLDRKVRSGFSLTELLVVIVIIIISLFPQIVLLLSKEFALLVVVAFALSVPFIYRAMNQWLDGFAYRIEISWGIFLAAGLAALGIAWLTVGYQSIKAAAANPVEALRYE